MEKQIEFLIDGVLNGSATLFIQDGTLDSTNAEDVFYKVRWRNNRRDFESYDLRWWKERKPTVLSTTQRTPPLTAGFFVIADR
jgi:hypothetical protein